MQKLITGIHKFQREAIGQYQGLFQRLSKKGQNPHTLFITCCDSRVLAELITQSQPGDLFVVKNIGNIVPPAHVMSQTNSTAAAIEFAVQQLKVQDIVVCGHSQCGAMEALLKDLPELDQSPHLCKWLEVAAPVRKVIENKYKHITDTEKVASIAAEENVLFALENLRTYPCVKKRLEEKTLRLHGWFFKIATAELFFYDPTTEQFQPLQKPS
ncbi:MAG: Carbonic anhydrase 1 [Chlamydiae bacterium]|nr:Carbonic anhydrase 1 [Chlamydiota bacterium]